MSSNDQSLLSFEEFVEPITAALGYPPPDNVNIFELDVDSMVLVEWLDGSGDLTDNVDVFETGTLREIYDAMVRSHDSA
jgi:hypothetical protein